LMVKFCRTECVVYFDREYGWSSGCLRPLEMTPRVNDSQGGLYVVYSAGISKMCSLPFLALQAFA
jgi:hypothetical protein